MNLTWLFPLLFSALASGMIAGTVVCIILFIVFAVIDTLVRRFRRWRNNRRFLAGKGGAYEW